MTLIIENASKELYTAIKSLAKIDNAKCKVQKPKLTKFEKEILKAKAELEKEKREGTLKTYASAKEAFEKRGLTLMYKVHLTKSFKKDAKALSQADRILSMQIIDILAKGEKLKSKHKDHALNGNLQGFRECHIKPDLLLIYELCDDILQLNALRVGSHSKLFKK